MGTLPRVPCKQRLPTWTHARYSLVEKGPVALTYVVSQNVPAAEREAADDAREAEAAWAAAAAAREAADDARAEATTREAADDARAEATTREADAVRGAAAVAAVAARREALAARERRRRQG